MNKITIDVKALRNLLQDYKSTILNIDRDARAMVQNLQDLAESEQ
jgi:hypothetical protein